MKKIYISLKIFGEGESPLLQARRTKRLWLQSMGSATGEGGHGPPKERTGGGGRVMHLAPQILGKILYVDN